MSLHRLWPVLGAVLALTSARCAGAPAIDAGNPDDARVVPDASRPADAPAQPTDAVAPGPDGELPSPDASPDAGADPRDAAPDAPRPACEAPSGARCYYVDPAHGDDANDGTLAHPFRTQLNLVSYYGSVDPGSTPAPATHVTLHPGDVIYLRAGTYAATYNYEGTREAFYFRGIDGAAGRPIRLVAFPGERAVIQPEMRANGVYLSQAAHWTVEDVEIANAWQNGVWVEEMDDVALRGLHVHDTDGIDNDNMTGVHLLSSTHVEVAGCSLHDNFDRTAADTGGQPTENSTNLVAFGGGFISLHDNHVFHTPATSRGMHSVCIKYKHMRSAPGGTFEVRNNRLENCPRTSIGSGSPDTTIVGNLLQDSGPITLENFGGPTQFTNIRVAYNTLVRTPALYFNAVDWDQNPGHTAPSGIRYDHNVVLDTASAYNNDAGFVLISSYGSDALYMLVTAPGVLALTNNCYFNARTAPMFNLFGAGGSYGALGGQYGFAAWQALGYDAGSLVADPQFDGAFHARLAGCADRGYDHAP